MLSANNISLKLSIIAVTAFALATLPSAARAQHGNDQPTGFPLDWSNSHVAYPPPANLQDLKKHEKDPRYLRHQYEDRRKWDKLADDAAGGHDRDHHKKGSKDSLTVDWAVSLAKGSVAKDMSPSMFTYAADGSGAPSCNDWVVYGLNVTGSTTTGAGQANLIALNNLYGSGNGCSASPAVLFAYADTAGTIATSPVISYNDNGLQVAFVENETGGAYLRVITYTSGSGTSAALPVAMPAGKSFRFSTHTDTNSPLYIDYTNDIAYVGDDNGTLYAITPVFGTGNPGLGWSLALQAGYVLTGPVLDQTHGVVLVGSNYGRLYAVSTTTHAAITGSPISFGERFGAAGAVVDPPVIVTGTTTYAFATAGCNATLANAVLQEASVSSTPTLASVATENIGQTSTFGGCPTTSMHAPALDDAVYNGSSGYLYVCGNIATGTAPEVRSYSFDPSGGALAPTTYTLTPTANTASECSPITYFTDSTVQKIFMGIGYASGGTMNSNTVSATNGGQFTATTQDTTPAGVGGTSGILVDNNTSTAGEANVYFTGLAAGNVTAPVGGTAGNCVQGIAVTGGSHTGGTVTLTGTFSTTSFLVGDTVIVAGVGGTSYNGTWELTGVTATTLKYADASASGTAGSGGTVGKGTCAFSMTQSGLS